MSSNSSLWAARRGRMSFAQRARAGPVLLLGLGAALGCSGEAIITLGAGAPVATFGDAGQRVRNLNEVGSNDQGATLTADLLEIYFVSDRDGGLGQGDIYRAQRASRTDPFNDPELVMALSTPDVEASPALSADGLTLWFASSREPSLGQLDVWRSTRSTLGEEWGAPQNVAALNSPFDERPGAPGGGGTLLPIASNREGGLDQIYLAHAQSMAFDAARLEALGYLWQTDASTEDPFLSDDGRLLFFRRAPPDGMGDLFVAWRRRPDDEFIDAAALLTINSPMDERDPFLSADQIRFFFSSTQRDGRQLDIYATSVALPEFQ